MMAKKQERCVMSSGLFFCVIGNYACKFNVITLLFSTFQRSKKELKRKHPSGGPTTRSRSNVRTAPQKDASTKAPHSSVLVEPAAQIQLPQIEGVGTMAAYVAMRKRQQTKTAEKNAAIASGSGTANEQVDGEDVLPDIGEEIEEG